MSEPYCEFEQDVAAMAAGGPGQSALAEHARHCRISSEVLQDAKLLGEGAGLSAAEFQYVPDASVVWRKAQRMARENALRRALRPIRAIRSVAVVLGIALLTVLGVRPQWLSSYLADFWSGHVPASYQLWSATSTGTDFMLMATGAGMLIGLGSWYLLRET